ncbi:MAG: hypothetical protein GF308_05555 [Candidatus Heimdallarchaeota archaeon]|nr:hypothetical protein [Candidatus Heimdallarchaeota archaeon]
MLNDKQTTLQDLLPKLKRLRDLVKADEKLTDTSINLLFDVRDVILHIMNSTKSLDHRSTRIIDHLKQRVDSLIDRARRQETRFTPGTQKNIRKQILKNMILYNLIIFSRSWDLKEVFTSIDSNIVFGDIEAIQKHSKTALDHIHIIDNLFSEKENILKDTLTTEELAENLSQNFYQELELAEKAGILKGIVQLEKPKLFGKEKYYDQLGNILLKVVQQSFGLEQQTKPIAVRAIITRLRADYPKVNAELSDVKKALVLLANNGLIILEEDEQGLQWLQLFPSESEASIILSLAKSKGYITLEEIVIETGWSQKKTSAELDKFVKAGCAVMDSSYADGTKYYFPGLTDQEES